MIDPNHSHFCFEHGAGYSDVSCPQCVNDVCSEHDSMMCSCGKRQKHKCSKENGHGTGKMCAKDLMPSHGIMQQLTAEAQEQGRYDESPL